MSVQSHPQVFSLILLEFLHDCVAFVFQLYNYSWHLVASPLNTCGLVAVVILSPLIPTSFRNQLESSHKQGC